MTKLSGQGRLGIIPSTPLTSPISYGFEGDLSKVKPYQGEIVLGPELFSIVDDKWTEAIKEI